MLADMNISILTYKITEQWLKDFALPPTIYMNPNKQKWSKF